MVRISRSLTAARHGPPPGDAEPYWSRAPDDALAALGTTRRGLSSEEAARRLAQTGSNVLEGGRPVSWPHALLVQLQSPLVLLLVAAAVISAIVREWTDASVVVAIVLGSAMLGAWHEWRAGAAVERLRARVQLRARVWRDGAVRDLPVAEIVAGDIVELQAGSLVPGDGVVVAARDFFVVESMLTGESFPVEKEPGSSPVASTLGERTNAVFFGTNVRSGTATVAIARTGRATELGRIAHTLTLERPETDFEAGLHRFGVLLMRVMLVLTFAVFVANVVFARPPIEALLFAIALAVGISPELLPAILTVTLARGATRMAERRVIVKRLTAIENLGAMDVLCCDKTGTLTEGVIRLDDAIDPEGESSRDVLALAWANATFESGIASPLDEAIRRRAEEDGVSLESARKIDEIPYDFVRRRVGIVVEHGAEGARERTLVVKGALDSILDACATVSAGDRDRPLERAERDALHARLEALFERGVRVLGVASRRVPDAERYGTRDEHDLVFRGFLLFRDRPKAGIERVLRDIAALGIDLKIVSGDARGVAVHLARTIGIDTRRVITGRELAAMSNEALGHAAPRTSIFAEVDPAQKERVIAALRSRGHVVGYLGDGINDAPALHQADVAISVEGAVDVAKEAADVVLGARDLDVLRAGVQAGRTTFANTLKYLYTTSSANFGNMVTMAIASAWLPFLPLTATQILLNNFLSDVPQSTVAGDSVDPEMVVAPRRWDVRAIRDFMIVFGLVSSVFDLLTFGALVWLGADVGEFRTAWFIESLLTELGIAFVVRTSRPIWRSRPGRALALSSLATGVVAMLLPYSPIAGPLAFVGLEVRWLLLIAGITVMYLVASEIVKHALGRRVGLASVRRPERTRPRTRRSRAARPSPFP